MKLEGLLSSHVKDDGNTVPRTKDNLSLHLIGYVGSYQNRGHALRATMAYPTTAASFWSTDYTTGDPDVEPSMPLSAKIVVGIICGVMVMVVLVGNTFVVVAVAKFRRLRTKANILLLNLAIADITVAVFVMTFSTMRVLSDGNWLLGMFMCKFWMSMDVLCCTASILNLCMISLDKYWAITRPLSYKRDMSWRRIAYMVTFVWICSGVISFVPIFSGLYARPDASHEICGVNFTVNKYYAIVSSMTSFYVPLAVMLFTYCRIYVIARSQALRIEEEMTRSEYLERSSPQCSLRSSPQLTGMEENGESVASGSNSRRRSRSITREYKAVRTLGLIMGCFILSWLPFFLMYVIMNFCGESCELSTHAEDAITWLGYANSLMNPLIYNFRNRDFRYAFKVIANKLFSILTCGYLDKKQGVFPMRGSHRRLSSSSNGHAPNGNTASCADGVKMARINRQESVGSVIMMKNGNGGTSEIPCAVILDNESLNGSISRETGGEFSPLQEDPENE